MRAHTQVRPYKDFPINEFVIVILKHDTSPGANRAAADTSPGLP